MKPWMINPDILENKTVQYWSNGIMITAQMPLSEARELVKRGEAFVMTKQAIRRNETQKVNS